MVLDFTAGDGVLHVTAPADGIEAPLGYWMLFLLDDGAPSEAVFMRTNRPPVAVGESVNVSGGDVVDLAVLLGNDSDPEHDGLSVEVVTAPAEGAIDDTASTWTAPAAGGSFTLTYRADDGTATSDVVEATFDVTEGEDPTPPVSDDPDPDPGDCEGCSSSLAAGSYAPGLALMLLLIRRRRQNAA